MTRNSKKMKFTGQFNPQPVLDRNVTGFEDFISTATPKLPFSTSPPPGKKNSWNDCLHFSTYLQDLKDQPSIQELHQYTAAALYY